MAYIKNDIQFNVFDTSSIGIGKKVSNEQYINVNINDLPDIELDNGKLPTIVNGLEIDWNNANLPNSNTSTGGNKTIKTTDELLKQINDIQKEIYILTDIIFTLKNAST